ncbi:MAG: hypothetical protein KKH12_03525 [Gammaproteobacteria bacterium]|nr:hypothetical protein [Gammaproteobacteria bacterium]MBU1480726.1 hypothetical protein [Gammaproteobacteria bacterium]
MTGSNDKDAASKPEGVERRTRPYLRDIFERAYEVACPLLDPEQNLHTTGSVHFLRVVLHDKFPELHQQDVAILSVAIERVFVERNKKEIPQ